MTDNSYNGWANWKTWNAGAQINNDEPLYMAAVDFMKRYNGDQAYKDFIAAMGMQESFTNDGDEWLDSEMDFSELNAMMKDLID